MLRIDIQKFGRVYDLTEELSTEKPVVKLGDKEYAFSSSFKTVTELDKAFKKNKDDVEFVKEFLTIAFGKQAADEMLALNLQIKAYKRIIKIVGEELASDDDDENSGEQG